MSDLYGNTYEELEDYVRALGKERKALREIQAAAIDLYDNRLGWSDGRNPYAPPEFWERLSDALVRFDLDN